MSTRFGVVARHVLGLGLAGARDEAIFHAARDAEAIVVTKDVDFVRLLERHGTPPHVLWLTLGNISNAGLWCAVEANWPRVLEHFARGEPLVEVSGKRE